MQTERTITERTTSQGDGGAKALSAQEYLHTPLAAVIVPFLISSVTGFLVGALALLVAVWWRVMDAWVWGLVFWLGAMLVMWMVMLWRWFGLTNLERLTGLDINGDGVVGKPGPRPAPVGVVVTLRRVSAEGRYQGTEYMTLPGDPESIVMFATALLGGGSLAERLWSGVGKPFSQKDFRQIRKELDDRKLLELKNEKDARQGYRLTPDGVLAMERVRDQYAGRTTPPLE